MRGEAGKDDRGGQEGDCGGEGEDGGAEHDIMEKPCCEERQQGECFCIVRKDGLYCSE